MKDNEYPVVQIADKIRWYAFIFPLCLLSALLSIFPLLFGLVDGRPFLSLISGLVFAGSLIALLLFARRERLLSDLMLLVSMEELAEMEAGLELLAKPSPSKVLH